MDLWWYTESLFKQRVYRYMSNLELYHGSLTGGLEVLEPRQARNGAFPDALEDPAVYASADINVAIFMALIGKRSWGGWDAEKYGGKGFYVYEEFAECLSPDKYEEPTGIVYQVSPESFNRTSVKEWRSVTPVRVLGSFTVGLLDLPPISITPELHPSHYR